jgi:hypothetical protein
MNRLLSLAMPALAVLLIVGGTPAQEPPRRPVRDSLARPDTLPPDTTTLPADSAGQEAQDTVPPPRFSAIFGGPPPAVAATVFYWDRDALQREAALTIGDLLDHVPGMTVLRAGLFHQPEAATAFGATRGRMEVVLDGFVLDPLIGSTLDLTSLELAQLAEVRVERRLDLTRIHLTTLEALHATPYSRIEAGTGEPTGSVLRGLFSAPRFIGGPFAFAIDRIDGNGRNGAEPADEFGGWVKWGWFPSPDRAIQLEYQQGRVRRKGGVPWTGEQSRGDLMLRARNRFLAGLSAELFAGRTSIEEPRPDTANPDSSAELKRTAWQYGARAALRQGAAWADAELRFRDSDALPSRQFDFAAGLQLGSMLQLAGNLTSTAWRTGESALAYDVRAELTPITGLAAFAEFADGERGAPLWADSAGISTLEAHALDNRTGTRLGITARPFGIEATGALVRLEADSAAPFGLPFDSAFGRTLARPAQGLEVFGRVPLWPRGVSVTGNFNYWDDIGTLLYLPLRSWRLALELHTLPLASGNLEILGRLEHQRREAMLERNPDSAVPVDPENPPTPFLTMPIRNLINGYLQIRIIDVRAFIHWYDLTGAGREDFPGRAVGGARILYGVKWQLFN